MLAKTLRKFILGISLLQNFPQFNYNFVVRCCFQCLILRFVNRGLMLTRRPVNQAQLKHSVPTRPPFPATSVVSSLILKSSFLVSQQATDFLTGRNDR